MVAKVTTETDWWKVHNGNVYYYILATACYYLVWVCLAHWLWKRRKKCLEDSSIVLKSWKLCVKSVVQNPIATPQEKIYLIIFATLWCRCLFPKFEHMCSDSLYMCSSTNVHWYTYVLNLVNKQLHYSITYEQIYIHYNITYEQIYIHYSIT